MNDQYDFEDRLHSDISDAPTLEAYWAEYQTFTGLSDEADYKIQREIAHKYYEITGQAYVSGAL